MMPLSNYRNQLHDVLQKNNVVKKAYLFGSAITPRFNEKSSDVDILVETANLPPEEKGEKLMLLWEDLEKIFARKVDLLTENSLQNPYLTKEINNTKKLIYDGQNSQILI